MSGAEQASDQADKTVRSGVWDFAIHYPSLTLASALVLAFLVGVAAERGEWGVVMICGFVVYVLANGLAVMAYSGGRRTPPHIKHEEKK